MSKKHFILASGSPRRKELLADMNYTFKVEKSDIEEIFNDNLPAHEIVMDLAQQKAVEVSKRFPDRVVLGSDTIVTYEGQLLGKPANEVEAKKMLKLLSNQTHAVFTGVAIVSDGETETFYEKTEVTFWELTEEEIDSYIATKEPFDKAGAYGIQGFGAYFVKEIKGDYFSVVGLPLSKTARELKKYGIYSF